MTAAVKNAQIPNFSFAQRRKNPYFFDREPKKDPTPTKEKEEKKKKPQQVEV